MHKTHSHSKEGKHSASLLCFFICYFLFASKTKEERSKQRWDQNKGSIKTKVRSNQRLPTWPVRLAGDQDPMRDPTLEQICLTQQLSLDSPNNFFGSTRTFNFRQQAACWSFFPFSELENFLQFCLRTRKALNTELDNIHPEMGEQVIHFDTVRHLEW